MYTMKNVFSGAGEALDCTFHGPESRFCLLMDIVVDWCSCFDGYNLETSEADGSYISESGRDVVDKSHTHKRHEPTTPFDPSLGV